MGGLVNIFDKSESFLYLSILFYSNVGTRYQRSVSESDHDWINHLLFPLYDGVVHSTARATDVSVLTFTDVLRL